MRETFEITCGLAAYPPVPTFIQLQKQLAETENEFRRRLQAVAAEAEVERLAIETRVQDLAQRVDDAVAVSRERLAELQALRIR